MIFPIDKLKNRDMMFVRQEILAQFLNGETKMITEQLIRQNQVCYQELLREAAQSQAAREINTPFVMGEALARTGDLLVAAGHGLQRRYRRMEQGVGMADYANGQRLGRAL